MSDTRDTMAVNDTTQGVRQGVLSWLLDFGRYHGVWAPGVRLMRSLSIRRQAALVMLVCALPLAVLFWRAAADARANLQAARTERTGLAHIGEIGEMIAATVSPAVEASARAPAPASAPAPGLAALRRAQQRFIAMVPSQVRDDDSATSLLNALRNRWAAASGDARSDHAADLQDLLLLHSRAIVVSGLEGSADATVRALVAGPIATMPRLAPLLHEVLTEADPATHGAASTTDRTLQLGDLLAQTAVLVGELRAAVDRAIATGMVDGERMRGDVRNIEHFELALRAYRSFVKTSGVQVAAIDGEHARDLVAAGAAQERLRLAAVMADKGARSIAMATSAALTARLEARRAALVSTLATEALLLGLSSLLAVYLAVCNYMVVSGGILHLCRHVAALASGNLSLNPIGRGKDEISVALNALGDSARRLSQTFTAITQGVGAVSHAAREVASGNRGLAGTSGGIRSAIVGVTERAGGFASLMHDCGNEVESTVAEVRAMRGDARRSRNAMSGLRERMRALNAKSREINEVVRLMEAIAFQTKLLALNASVEAARAGVEGKGFAVVAQEVRALALRSEQSAQRIHHIVDASMVQIEDCNRVAEEASAAVTATDERIQAVHRSMANIVAQTQIGMTGSREVASVTSEADAAIDGSARIIDQLSAASAGLQDQGDALRRSVQHFILA